MSRGIKNFSTCAYSVDWSVDGTLLAVGGWDNTDDLRIYDINYNYSYKSPTFNNSIIFGDSLKGSDYDLDVNIFSGA